MSRPRIHEKPLRKQIVMDSDDYKKAKRLAKERGISFSAIISQLVREEFSKPRE